MVGGVGYNPPGVHPVRSRTSSICALIVTNLCVMDFGGPEHAVRGPRCIRRDLRGSTGRDRLPAVVRARLEGHGRPDRGTARDHPSPGPHNIRASILKDNPPGIRAAA